MGRLGEVGCTIFHPSAPHVWVWPWTQKWKGESMQQNSITTADLRFSMISLSLPSARSNHSCNHICQSELMVTPKAAIASLSRGQTRRVNKQRCASETTNQHALGMFNILYVTILCVYILYMHIHIYVWWWIMFEIVYINLSTSLSCPLPCWLVFSSKLWRDASWSTTVAYPTFAVIF